MFDGEKSPLEVFRTNIRYQWERPFANALVQAKTFTALAWIIESNSPIQLDESNEAKWAKKLYLTEEQIRSARSHISSIVANLQAGTLRTENAPELLVFKQVPFSDITYRAIKNTIRRIRSNIDGDDEKYGGFAKEYAKSTRITVSGNIKTDLHQISIPNSKKNVLLCPGSFTGPMNLRHSAYAFANLGYNTFAPEVNTPEQEFYEGSDEALSVIAQGYSASVEAGLLHALKEKPGEKIDLAGFSTGAAAVLNAALRHPSKVSKVVLLNPIGVANVDDTFIKRMQQIIGGSAKHGAKLLEQELLNTEQHPLYADFAEWVPRQLGRKLKFGELLQIAHTAITANLVPKIKQLRDKGVEVIILATEDDALMPIEKIEESLDKAGLRDILLTLTGLHTKIGQDPEATAEWISTWLEQTTK